MPDSVWNSKRGFWISYALGGVFSLILGIVAIFVWPSGFAVAPIWRFLVGFCLGGIILLLILPVVAAVQFRKTGVRLRKPWDRSGSPREQ